VGRPFSMEPYIPVRGQSTGRSDKRRLRRTVEVEPELESPWHLPPVATAQRMGSQRHVGTFTGQPAASAAATPVTFE